MILIIITMKKSTDIFNKKKQFQGFDKQAYLKWAKAVIAAILAQSAMLPPLSNTCTSTLIDQTYVT